MSWEWANQEGSSTGSRSRSESDTADDRDGPPDNEDCGSDPSCDADSPVRAAEPTIDPSTLASVVARPTGRRLLSVLCSSSHPLTVRDIAVGVATTGTDSSEFDGERERLQLHLAHEFLPKLRTEGWIERRTEGIVTTERFSLDGTVVTESLLAEADHPAWKPFAALVGRPLRQAVVTELSDADATEGLTLPAIASAVGASPSASVSDRGTGGDSRDRSQYELDSLRTQLHHVELPALHEVELVRYDVSDRLVLHGRLFPVLQSWIGPMEWTSSTIE